MIHAEWFFWLTGFAGAVHMISPDHWVPLSILSWQRGWRFPKLFAVGVALALGHVGLAFLIYRALGFFLDAIQPQDLVLFAGILIAVVALFRTFRFDRIGEVFGSGSKKTVVRIFTVLSLLGPSEALLPILMKAKMIGVGAEIPCAGFAAGTFLASMAFAIGSHLVWNKPYSLPRLLSFTRRRYALAPMTAGIALGLILLVATR